MEALRVYQSVRVLERSSVRETIGTIGTAGTGSSRGTAGTSETRFSQVVQSTKLKDIDKDLAVQ